MSLPANLSSSTSSRVNVPANGFGGFNSAVSSSTSQDQLQKPNKKRRVPGNPDPGAEVIALSPETLLATNRYVCEICNKGFQRDQNLQLHLRGHNLPWKLKQKDPKDTTKKAYVCPEPTCIHHHPSRALGDLTGIKKHYCRKHGQKKWKCDRCAKVYAVQSDWKAHSKVCGGREHVCDCGTLFTRKESLTSHKAFCDALAEERARVFFPAAAAGGGYPKMAAYSAPAATLLQTRLPPPFLPFSSHHRHFPNLPPPVQYPNPNPNNHGHDHIKPETGFLHVPLIRPPLIYPGNTLIPSLHLSPALAPLSATAILQRKEAVDRYVSSKVDNTTSDGITRDFLGLAEGSGNGGNSLGINAGQGI